MAQTGDDRLAQAAFRRSAALALERDAAAYRRTEKTTLRLAQQFARQMKSPWSIGELRPADIMGDSYTMIFNDRAALGQARNEAKAAAREQRELARPLEKAASRLRRDALGDSAIGWLQNTAARLRALV